MTQLANRIRELRYAKGWGPNDLSKRAKISRTALYHLESGRTEKPQAATLRRIARALAVEPEALILEVAHSEATSATEPQVISAPVAVAVTTVDRHRDVVGLMNKFLALMASPMAEGVARIVDESYRLLPIGPTVTESDSESTHSAVATHFSR